MANIGQIIDDKYEILTLIGQGGMSKVYLARDRRLNKQWAVKEIQKKARDKNNEVVVQSAIAEANMIKQLDHPSIVRIVDIIDNPDVIYIIEDYIEGETLNTILEQNGAQSQENVIEWAMQICEALEYLHTRKKPIIYRDMKPSNVMLKPDGNIKIIDFGIAREYKEQSLADTVSLGTKGYAAPEQFGGKGQTDARTDIYCLGVTLYHLVTGHSPSEPPYEIYPIRTWNPQLDPGLEAVIEKCVQLNPNDRYQSCAELLYALQHYQENGALYKKQQKSKLNKFILTTVFAIFFALIGVFGIGMRTYTNNSDYNTFIANAQVATDSNKKAQNCIEAIELKPNLLWDEFDDSDEDKKSNPYFMLIEAYKSDAKFTIEEEKELLEVLEKKLVDLKNQPGYGELAFEIGNLYWYYYDYGKENSDNDNFVTRATSSVEWFNSAIDYGGEFSEYYLMAKTYSEIGTFHSNITLKQNEASDKGMYKPYWENIVSLVDMLSSTEDVNELIELETYNIAIVSIGKYSKKFIADGVPTSEITNLYNKVKIAVDNVDADTDKTEQLKADIIEKYNGIPTSITNER